VKEAVQNLGLKGWIQDLTAQEDMAGVYFKPDE
jgi:putative ubiquitin-RnfH superfamily antitoxin RatB of RatAB toxin-antitoxin module